MGVIGESRGADGPEPSAFHPDRQRQRAGVWGGLQPELTNPDEPEGAAEPRAAHRSGGASRFPENSSPPVRAFRGL